MNAPATFPTDRIPAVDRALAENAIADKLIEAIRDWQGSNLALAQRYTRNREQCELVDRHAMAKLFEKLTYADCEAAEVAADELRRQFNVDPDDGFRTYDAGALGGDDSWKDAPLSSFADSGGDCQHPLRGRAA